MFLQRYDFVPLVSYLLLWLQDSYSISLNLWFLACLFFPSFSGVGRLERAEKFPFSAGMRLRHSLSPYIFRPFLGRRVWLCHQDYSSLFLPEPWGIFLRTSLWETGGVPWGKMCGVSPTLWLPKFLIFTLVYSASSNLSKLPYKRSYQFMASAASTPGKQILALDLPVSPDFWVAVGPASSVLCGPWNHCFSVYSGFILL